MLTGILAVRNLVRGEHNDLWSVNTDQDYHEEIHEELAFEPGLQAIKETLAQVFPKLDRLALGLSTGTVAGVLLFLATIFLVLKGGYTAGPNLQLLENYFPGYSVTVSGSLLGLLYGFIGGFVGGSVFAFLRNITVFLYAALVQQRVERLLIRNIIEYI